MHPARFTGRLIKINFKDSWHDNSLDAIRTNPFVHLLSQRFTLRLSEEPDFLIYSDYGQEHKNYSCTRIYWTGENHRPNFDDCDYAFTFDHSPDPRHYRLPNFAFFIYAAPERFLAPRDAEQLLQGKTKFCNFIVSHAGCPEREEFYKLLSAYKRIDAPGRVFNNTGGLGHSENWFKDKVRFIQPYKFSIVFENSTYPGYTTEKLVSAMFADSVGIYWGNPDVGRDFNTKSFINCHDFANFDAVVEHIEQIDQDNEMYKQYLSEPFVRDNIVRPELSADGVLDAFDEIFSCHSS